MKLWLSLKRLSFTVLILNYCLIYQKQAEVPKKKKKTKKSKTDDNDSGVEAYFREEDDKEDEEDTKSDPVKVR